jgi:nucleoside diphosphate-linked moiety X motif 19, mitochondrial
MDKQDECLSWINFFKHHKVKSEEIRRNSSAKKPFIYDQRSSKLEREISLRLTAIRETFEELGVVLCKDPKYSSDSAFTTYFHTKNCDIPEWQFKIHNGHETLQKFCDTYNVIPNILDVYEWSVWLTPTMYPKRFETAFFLVTLNSIPPIYPEAHEVQDFYVGIGKNVN